MPKRLCLDELQPVKKGVEFSDLFRIIPTDLTYDEIDSELEAIKEAIEIGCALDGRYYRQDLYLSTDTLLQTTGIMHLHLGSQTGDQLLWLIEYETYVLFLEVTGHLNRFSDKPPGRTLLDMHSAYIRRLEVLMDKPQPIKTKTVVLQKRKVLRKSCNLPNSELNAQIRDSLRLSKDK